MKPRQPTQSVPKERCTTTKTTYNSAIQQKASQHKARVEQWRIISDSIVMVPENPPARSPINYITLQKLEPQGHYSLDEKSKCSAKKEQDD